MCKKVEMPYKILIYLYEKKYDMFSVKFPETKVLGGTL